MNNQNFSKRELLIASVLLLVGGVAAILRGTTGGWGRYSVPNSDPITVRMVGFLFLLGALYLYVKYKKYPK
jgi:hypothetical protein